VVWSMVRISEVKRGWMTNYRRRRKERSKGSQRAGPGRRGEEKSGLTWKSVQSWPMQWTRAYRTRG
jgi:hypothetical protein